VQNLVDFIVLSIREDDVGGEVFLVNDGHDLTIQELVNIIAGSLLKGIIPTSAWTASYSSAAGPEKSRTYRYWWQSV